MQITSTAISIRCRVEPGLCVPRNPISNRRRPTSDIDTEGLPRERLLEDALTEIACEKERIGSPGPQSREEANMGDADRLTCSSMQRLFLVVGETWCTPNRHLL